MSGKGDNQERERTRLDKWLWAARFFKTRALAQDAVDGGRVHCDGQRTKSSRDVQVGARIAVTIGHDTREVTVTALSDKRGDAKAAALLYLETEASRIAREAAAIARKELAMGNPVQDHRPDKRERRQFEKFRDRNS